jgi:glycosyltransferase involved in cell wall biosynthesis
MMRRRIVVQIAPFYPPSLGGLERVAESLSIRLAQGHEVRVVTSARAAERLPARQSAGGVSVRRHRAVVVAHTPIAPGVLGSLLFAPSDAVFHFHCAQALWPEMVMLASRLRGRRFIVHFHLDVDASGPIGRILPAYKRLLFGRSLRAAAAVIALTEAQADFLHEAYRIPRERISVVPNGIEERYFMPVREPGAQEPTNLLFVGRLDAQKNVARLLAALKLVESPVRLHVVGDGEQRGELEARAADLGLDVRFAGRLLGEDLLEAYRRADVFVLPSDREGMPLAVLEAMAAGLPVVATDVPGNDALLRGVGVLAQPDPEHLAAAIDSLAGDPALRHAVAERCSAAVRGQSWDIVAARIESVYAEVYE